METDTTTDLPPEAVEYARLHEEKRVMILKLQEIHQKIRACSEIIIPKMIAQDRTAYALCPTLEEEPIFGKMGGIELRTKKKYEVFRKDTVGFYIIKCLHYLIPNEPEVDLQKIGYGIGNWVWENRHQVPIRYLTRLYAKEEKPAEESRPKKRKRKGEQLGLSTEEIAALDIPTTREEFMAIPAFRKLFSL